MSRGRNRRAADARMSLCTYCHALLAPETQAGFNLSPLFRVRRPNGHDEHCPITKTGARGAAACKRARRNIEESWTGRDGDEQCRRQKRQRMVDRNHALRASSACRT